MSATDRHLHQTMGQFRRVQTILAMQELAAISADTSDGQLRAEKSETKAMPNPRPTFIQALHQHATLWRDSSSNACGIQVLSCPLQQF
jgi:hypothetical protein